VKCSVAQTGFGFVWHVRDGDRVSYIRVYINLRTFFAIRDLSKMGP
jgi:hypothetical protein